MKKNILPLLVLVLFLLSLTGCGNPTSETKETETIATEEDTTIINGEQMMIFKMNEIPYHAEGSTLLSGTSLQMDWTASGMSLSFDGQGDVKATMVGENGKCCIVTIEVDGVRAKSIRIGGTATEYTLAEGLASGAHTIRVLNEVGYDGGWITMESVSLRKDTKFAVIPDRDLYIEFIGDSITCGCGLSDEVLAKQYSTNEAYFALNDGLRGYAYLTAKALRADYSIRSIGGVRFTEFGMNGAYISNYYPFQSKKRDDTAYHPTHTPDILVLNLGQNDNYQYWVNTDHTNTDKGPFTKDAFREAVRRTISEIDAVYGEKKVPILYAYGCMELPERTAMTDILLNELIPEFRAMGYDIETFKMTSDRTGYSAHPSLGGAEKQSEELTAFIRDTYMGG